MANVKSSGKGEQGAPAALSQAQALEIFEKSLDVLRVAGGEIMFCNQRGGFAIVIRGVSLNTETSSLQLAPAPVTRPRVGTPAASVLAADFYGETLSDMALTLVRVRTALENLLPVAVNGLEAARYEGADIAGADAAISAAKGLI